MNLKKIPLGCWAYIILAVVGILAVIIYTDFFGFLVLLPHFVLVAVIVYGIIKQFKWTPIVFILGRVMLFALAIVIAIYLPLVQYNHLEFAEAVGQEVFIIALFGFYFFKKRKDYFVN